MAEEERLETITPSEKEKKEELENNLDDEDQEEEDYEEYEDEDNEDSQTPQDILRAWHERESQIKSLIVDNLGINSDEWEAVLEAEKREVRKILDSMDAEEYKRFI